MRILELLASPMWTGPAEPMASVAVELTRRGHSVEAAVDSVRPGDLRERLRALRLPLREELALSTHSGPLRIAADLRALRRLSPRFDVLHCNFSHDHVQSLLACAGRSEPRIVRTVHSERSLRARPLQRWVHRRTDGLIAVCEAHARVLREEFGVDPRRVIAVRGAVDSTLFTPHGDDLRRELQIPDDAPVVGIVSRVKPERRHRELLDAFRNALRELPQARLLIVGRGEALPELQAQVARNGMQRSVVFAGYRSGGQLAAAYRTLNAKVLLAEGNDGTCRAMLEAMACGRPVIAYRFGAPAEVIAEGITGMLLDAGDVAGLGAALMKLLGDRKLASRMGAAARSRVESFTPPARGEAVERFLTDVLALPPASAKRLARGSRITAPRSP